jgi:hypothetical protein
MQLNIVLCSPYETFRCIQNYFKFWTFSLEVIGQKKKPTQAKTRSQEDIFMTGIKPYTNIHPCDLSPLWYKPLTTAVYLFYFLCRGAFDSALSCTRCNVELSSTCLSAMFCVSLSWSPANTSKLFEILKKKKRDLLKNWFAPEHLNWQNDFGMRSVEKHDRCGLPYCKLCDLPMSDFRISVLTLIFSKYKSVLKIF